jgi:hypothetical protein
MPLTISQNGGTLYFRQVSGSVEYSNNLTNWTPVTTGVQFPLTITNSSPSSINILTVKLTTDVTFTTSYGGLNQFICGTTYITFDGMGYTCTLNMITGYNGFIQNLSGPPSDGSGFSNITVKNIKVLSSGSSLANSAGWVCCSNFGRSVTNVLVKNCSSNGTITSFGSGGICGGNAGVKGVITIENCFSTGIISGFGAGGICGQVAGGGFGVAFQGSANITNCYSTGAISGNSAGGICGYFAGQNYGRVILTQCYSNGAISGSNAGGICGSNTAESSGSVSVTNSYSSSSGYISDISRGIYGASSSGATDPSNCYIANNAWSSTDADTDLLSGTTPFPFDQVGTVWAYANGISTSTPYILSAFYLTITSVVRGLNYTIDIGGESFNNVTSVFINGQTTSALFTISSNTAISVIASTYTDISLVTVANLSRSVSYTVTPPIVPVCFIAGTPILTDQGIIHIDKINPKIHTIHNKRIVAITRTITNEDTLVCIEPDALGPNIPSEKTTVSRCHAILFNGKMVRAKKLVSLISDKNKVYYVKYNKEILYNILMEVHERISVNNMIAETLDPNHMIAKLYAGNRDYYEIQKTM